jgi:adenylosuccinate synthase
MEIKHVDVCCGLHWGDEAKGKVIAQLAKTGKYDFVCRWSGGQNAGHTVYVNSKKYKTHIIPSGIFYGIPSIIGPDCVIHPATFFQELTYLREHGFTNVDTLVKISPKAHIVTDLHVEEDCERNVSNGISSSTNRGIAPCYRDKYFRTGIQAKDLYILHDYMWDERLYGTVLCEGAQGFWLDINQGNYPYVTSSTTLPYGACSLGFPPQLIRTIYGVSKIYDTRIGYDPDFPETLLDDPELSHIADIGQEFGTTTGRRRKVNWLNLDKMVQAIQISGATVIIISKVDILCTVNNYKLYVSNVLTDFESMDEMKGCIVAYIRDKCTYVTKILFSHDVETVHGLLDS